MSIPIGTRIDTYEIVDSLGSGGMGEVYRARDSKLNREVAVKILPEAFAANPDRLARFEREAQTLAALNHRAGAATSVDPTWIAEFGSPVLSPDGIRLAMAIQTEESRDIWIAQLDRGPRLRLTVDGARNDYPSWSSDGRQVTFASVGSPAKRARRSRVDRDEVRRERMPRLIS